MRGNARPDVAAAQIIRMYVRRLVPAAVALAVDQAIERAEASHRRLAQFTIERIAAATTLTALAAMPASYPRHYAMLKMPVAAGVMVRRLPAARLNAAVESCE